MKEDDGQKKEGCLGDVIPRFARVGVSLRILAADV